MGAHNPPDHISSQRDAKWSWCDPKMPGGQSVIPCNCLRTDHLCFNLAPMPERLFLKPGVQYRNFILYVGLCACLLFLHLVTSTRTPSQSYQEQEWLTRRKEISFGLCLFSWKISVWSFSLVKCFFSWWFWCRPDNRFVQMKGSKSNTWHAIFLKECGQLYLLVV